ALHFGREFTNILVLALTKGLLCRLDVDLAGCVGDVGDLRIGRLSGVLCKCTARGKAYGGNCRDETNGHSALLSRPGQPAGAVIDVDGVGSQEVPKFVAFQASSHVRFGSKADITQLGKKSLFDHVHRGSTRVLATPIAHGADDRAKVATLCGEDVLGPRGAHR